MKRRAFLRQAALAGLGIGMQPQQLWSRDRAVAHHLTILHTNDVHSRMDPFPEGSGALAGLGGAARRAALIARLRREHEHVLLLDSGDMLQGTPYFNLFDGEVEFRAMSAMGYDAATLGNHDFDGGLDLLARRREQIGFSLLSANYDVSDTPLAGWVQPWQVFTRGPLRIGVFGLGIALRGLVPDQLYGETRYLEPIPVANQVAAHLRRKEGCHLVICLSHLGYRYASGQVSDVRLAAASREIDLILGGHTHTLLSQPDQIANEDGRPVWVAQAGWGGAMLGQLNLGFDRRLHRCRLWGGLMNI